MTRAEPGRSVGSGRARAASRAGAAPALRAGHGHTVTRGGRHPDGARPGHTGSQANSGREQDWGSGLENKVESEQRSPPPQMGVTVAFFILKGKTAVRRR